MKTIKIKKEHIKFIKTNTNCLDNAEILMNQGADQSRRAHKQLWWFLEKKYSLNDKKQHQLDYSKMEIIEVD